MTKNEYEWQFDETKLRIWTQYVSPDEIELKILFTIVLFMC